MEIEKTKMIEKTLPEFCNEAETLVKNTVIHDCKAHYRSH